MLRIAQERENKSTKFLFQKLLSKDKCLCLTLVYEYTIYCLFDRPDVAGAVLQTAL